MSRRGRTFTRLMGGVAAIALLASAGVARAQELALSIEPQPLGDALNKFAVQANSAVVFAPGLVAAKTSRGVANAPTAEIALAQLLQGTGLTYRQNGETFLIVQEGGSPQDQSAERGGAEVEALIVTAQKKEEAIQDVPIAISAFTQKSLDAQKIEGGFDLLKAIPNVTFSKSNFSGYNFSIRGIGTKAVSATTDPGVAVAFNNTTLIVNRLFEQEYFDVERVEVLRGPQGTLYGRNATSGVINVLSARPRLGEFEGDIKLEGGNYNAMRVRGMVNIPVGDTLAVRLAGAMTKRDGYGVNEAADDPDNPNNVSRDVDDRDLWSGRITVGWEPMEGVRANLMWEHFEEDDRRVRTSKQLCHRDPGPQQVGAFDWETSTYIYSPLLRNDTSQGCLPGSLYDEGAFGTPNGASLPYISGLYYATYFYSTLFNGPYGFGGNPYYDPPGATGPFQSPAPCAEAARYTVMYPLDLCRPDPYGGQTQSQDLRTIKSLIEPTYRAKADIFELSLDVDLGESLTFTSQTVYSKDDYYATQDYNRFSTFPIFNDSATACDYGFSFATFSNGPVCTPDGFGQGGVGNYAGGFYAGLTPGGIFTDPQLGASRSLVAQDLSQAVSEQYNQEFRLVSNFDSELNFSLGANFTRFKTLNDYYVFINAATLIASMIPFNSHIGCQWTNSSTSLGTAPCIYIDPNPLESINGEGHNYFRSANPYELTSSALFGEFYWQATETLKVTLGARMSWDRKVFTPIPSQLLLADYRQSGIAGPGDGPEGCNIGGSLFCAHLGTGVGGRGSPPNPDIVQEWREPTGRLIVDWKPELGFTDETMVYGSVAHGYKGGGANPPGIAPPAGIFNAINSGGVAPPTFEPEYIDAFEVGTKNTLLGGALVLNGSAFYYDYEGYQVSKIVDRSAANENFDATLWGVELEWIFSPMRNLRFNGTFGHLRTEIADGEQSIDLMDRTQSDRYSFTTPDGVTYDEWMVMKPWLSSSSNCIVPVAIVEQDHLFGAGQFAGFYCPGGNPAGFQTRFWGLYDYDPVTDAPNGGAGFFADLSGNELPNAPHWTASLGAQYRMALPGGWDATLRGDFYWQSQSFHRVYNTQYDKLRAWTNTNISLWVENPDWGVTAEVYVKNAFDETPITDAFLNSDDSGLTTNVFTLDPRLVGVSIRKSF